MTQPHARTRTAQGLEIIQGSPTRDCVFCGDRNHYGACEELLAEREDATRTGRGRPVPHSRSGPRCLSQRYGKDKFWVMPPPLLTMSGQEAFDLFTHSDWVWRPLPEPPEETLRGKLQASLDEWWHGRQQFVR